MSSYKTILNTFLLLKHLKCIRTYPFSSCAFFLVSSSIHPSIRLSLLQTKGNSCVSLLVVAIICFIEHSVQCAQFTAISIKAEEKGEALEEQQMTHDLEGKRGREESVGPWGTQSPLYLHPTCFSSPTASMPACIVAACRFSLLYSLLLLLHLLFGMLHPPFPPPFLSLPPPHPPLYLCITNSNIKL